MGENAMKFIVSIVFGLIAIALAVAASLPSPLVVFDKVVVGALLAGGFAAGGIALNYGANIPRERAAMRAAARPKRG